MKNPNAKKLVKKVQTVCDFNLSPANIFPTETTIGTDPTNTMITTITTVNTHMHR
jgi:hypothetical protein